MQNNLPKVIGSIVAIIAAGLLIFWQIKANGPKKYTVSDAQKQAMATEESAVRAVFEPALEMASKSGWDATAKYWANGKLNTKTKKFLKQVFGSSFNSADLKKMNISRDSENGMQCALFEYDGKNYAFYFSKSKQGKYQICDFTLW